MPNSLITYFPEAMFCILLTLSFVFGMNLFATIILASLVFPISCRSFVALKSFEYKEDFDNKMGEMTQLVEELGKELKEQKANAEFLKVKIDSIESRSQLVEMDRAFKRQVVHNGEETQKLANKARLF